MSLTPSLKLTGGPRTQIFESDGIFDQVTKFDGLWNGWVRVRANAGAAGGDGVTITQFGHSAQNLVSQLSHQLRSGRYSPGPVRRIYVPKFKGGKRPIDIPCVRDRVIQAAAASALVPILEPEFEDSSFAYRPGRSVADAVRRVMALRREGYQHVIDADIQSYFENVPHARLISQLERYVHDASLIDLVGLWLEHHSHLERGLPQGSPISPILANLYLDSIDEAIAMRGVRLVRYADDFLVLCKSEALAGNTLERLAHLLDEQGLALNAEKTRVVDFDKGFTFLGHAFVRGMVWQEAARLDTTPNEADAHIADVTQIDELDALHNSSDRHADKAPRGRWAPRQRILYILEPGRVLSVDGESFIVRGGESKAALIKIPHQRLDRIELGPDTELEAAALDLAASSETSVFRIDGYGQAIGRWVGRSGGNAERHLAQCALTLDAPRRLAQARLIVSGRIRNQRVQLKRMARTRPEGDLSKTTAKLAQLIRQVERKPDLSIEQIMGFEGAAAALYWPSVSALLGQPEIFGGQRARRVGHDPLNCVMDILAGLLTRDVTVAVERAGLHPGIGVLHATTAGSEALVFDLIEAFRAPILEACAFAMIGRKALTSTDFSNSAQGWRLTRVGWAVVIRQYEAWVQRPILSPHSNQRVLWRGLFEEEALAFAQACEAKSVFTPYRMDW